MTVTEILRHATDAGLELEADGRKLKIRGKAAPSRGLLEEIRAHRDELVAALTPPTPEDLALDGQSRVDWSLWAEQPQFWAFGEVRPRYLNRGGKKTSGRVGQRLKVQRLKDADIRWEFHS